MSEETSHQKEKLKEWFESVNVVRYVVDSVLLISNYSSEFYFNLLRVLNKVCKRKNIKFINTLSSKSIIVDFRFFKLRLGELEVSKFLTKQGDVIIYCVLSINTMRLIPILIIYAITSGIKNKLLRLFRK